MSILFLSVIPIFAVIALGVVASRTGVVPVDAMPSLNRFVFNIAMPALIVAMLAEQSAEDLWRPNLLAAWALTGAALFALTYFGLRYAMGARSGAAAIAAQGATVGNIGFLGFPLAFSIFGPEAAGPLAIALVVDLALIIPFSILLIEGAGRGAATALLAAFRNPFLLSILVGVLAALSPIAPPEPVLEGLRFLGAAAAPTALFALGLMLSSLKVEEVAAPAIGLSALKLLAHPAALLGCFFLLGVEGDAVAVALMIAALPVAGNVFVIAQRYGLAEGPVTAAIVVSTALSLATIPVVAFYAESLIGALTETP